MKSKKKHLLKISAVYLIGNPEICQDPPSCGQDDQTLLHSFLSWNNLFARTILFCICYMKSHTCMKTVNKLLNSFWVTGNFEYREILYSLQKMSVVNKNHFSQKPFFFAKAIFAKAIFLKKLFFCKIGSYFIASYCNTKKI